MILQRKKIIFLLILTIGFIHRLYAQELTTFPAGESMYITIEGKRYSGNLGEDFSGNAFLNLNRSDDDDLSLINFNRNSNQPQIGVPANRWELGLISGEAFGLYSYHAVEVPARTPALTFRVQDAYASFGSPDYPAKVSILNTRGQGMNVQASGNSIYGESIGTGSQAGYGIWGKSLARNGVFGESQQAHAIYGRLIGSGTEGSGLAGVRGLATEKNNFGISGYNVHGIGVFGESVDSVGVYGKGTHGILGFGQGQGSRGVRGVGDVGVSGSGTSTGISAFSALGTGLIAYTYAGQYAGQFNGDVYTTGLYLPSDQALKENIYRIEGALSLISQLDPKSYFFHRRNYKNAQTTEILHFGLIAQDVEKILPQLIKETKVVAFDEHGFSLESDEEIKAINYLELIPILIRGIQEQQEMIAQMQKQIIFLENQIDFIVDEK